MTPPSETHSDDLGSLGESGYEFVDTDEDSRGAATELSESVTSDFGRPDDIASLADTEHSYNDDSESDKSHVVSDLPAFTGLNAIPHTPAIISTSDRLGDDSDKNMAHSIEFEEPLSLGDENVSVKHTIVDFNEDETARIAEQMALRSPPKRLVATIRQTMTRQGLSTKEPLRILYVGCQSAKQDIIRKIASSVAASVGNGRNSILPGPRSSQVFHVVPISAFGSEEAPQIELMQSSGYQIKVEDCFNATNIKFNEESGRPDILRLMLDDNNYGYNSVPIDSGFKLQPAWELPHVGIFYCSENDTQEMKRTRTFAKSFMSRHRVPTIVISHKQLFDKSFGGISLDQHSVHMCLESRDPSGSRNIIHQRLPIDLDSFKTIDARQMNRNLAYLTGLHETIDTIDHSSFRVGQTSRSQPSDIEKTSYNLSDSVGFLRTRAGAEWRALVAVGVLLLGVVVTVFTGSLKYRTINSHSMSINGNLTVTEHTSFISSTIPSTAVSDVSTSLWTSIMTQTATRTSTMLHSQSLIANSLAIKPAMELGKIGETVQLSKSTEEQSTFCSAEILGDREILIRIPEAKMLSWLSREALSVNMSRDDRKVEPERAYTAADGIILQLAKDQAYGILNISVLTTRRPKINETFTMDFGCDRTLDSKSLFWTDFHDQSEYVNKLVNATVMQWMDYARNVALQSDFLVELTRQRLELLKKLAEEQTVESSKRLTMAAKDISLKLTKWGAILSKEASMHVQEAQNQLDKFREELNAMRDQSLGEPLADIIFRAQVKSKLYWLKLQGRQAEYQKYERRAADAIKKRLDEAKRARRKLEGKAKKMEKRGKRSCFKKTRSCRGS